MPHKLLNNSGKLITVSLIIIGFLLISMTAVSIFFFQKEVERRKIAEVSYQESQNRALKLENDLKESKKQAFLLEEKNKEADDRINSLLDELELQEALKSEMKNETASLKEQLQKEIQSKEEVRKELLDDLSRSEQKIIELEAQVKVEISKQEELKAAKDSLEKKLRSGDGQITFSNDLPDDGFSSDLKSELIPDEAKGQSDKVDLDKIVVVPHEVPKGRVLSIDTDTEFVIINLGDKDGVKAGDVLSVSRGNEYLGDIKVTRVQPEMSAADLIPPLSSKAIRKNDQTVLRR